MDNRWVGGGIGGGWEVDWVVEGTECGIGGALGVDCNCIGGGKGGGLEVERRWIGGGTAGDPEVDWR